MSGGFRIVSDKLVFAVILLTDKQTNRQTDRQTDKQTGPITNRHNFVGGGKTVHSVDGYASPLLH